MRRRCIRWLEVEEAPVHQALLVQQGRKDRLVHKAHLAHLAADKLILV